MKHLEILDYSLSVFFPQVFKYFKDDHIKPTADRRICLQCQLLVLTPLLPPSTDLKQRCLTKMCNKL